MYLCIEVDLCLFENSIEFWGFFCLLLQVGIGGGLRLNDFYCWERLEDLDFFKDICRFVILVNLGLDLVVEMVVVLLVVFIVFRDDFKYLQGLVNVVKVFYVFVKLKFGSFVQNFFGFERVIYNVIFFNDELIWGSIWLYFVIGNIIYLGDVIICSIENSN